MKILHTGDWHIGHVLYGYDRACDHDSMLSAIYEVAKKEQPDVMVVSGDIFHTGQPSASSVHLLSQYLLKISDACPNMITVATAGNHDSPSRHEATAELWRKQRVEMVGQVKCNANDEITNDILDSIIVPIADKGFVLAMPYVHHRNVPDNFYQLLLDRVAERNTANLPVVLMAHLAVAGADFTGHEVREDSNLRIVGGLDTVPLPELGIGYDYLALGHIHHAQYVSGSDNRARYAGSPMPVSFDEAYAHTVSIVEIETHGSAPQVRTVDINAGRKLITIGGAKGMTWDEVRSSLDFMLNDEDMPKGSLIRVNIHLKPGESLPTEAESVVRSMVTDSGQHYCRINVVRDDLQSAITDRDINIDELRKIPPIDLAKRYATDTGNALTDEMAEMFNEIVKLVNDESNED